MSKQFTAATADGTFFSRTLYAAVSFEMDGQGDAVAMNYMPEGASFRGERMAHRRGEDG